MAIIRVPFLLLMLAMAMVAESTSWDAASQWTLSHFQSSSGLSSEKMCNSHVGDCIDEEEEMMMDSAEKTRRALYNTNTKFISYGALKKDRIPCSQRGSSYYNCGKSKKVNPYRRGCSVITRCYRFTK